MEIDEKLVAEMPLAELAPAEAPTDTAASKAIVIARRPRITVRETAAIERKAPR